VTILLDWSRGL